MDSYRVGDDEEVRLRAVLGGSLCEFTDNGSVGVEEIVAGHARLARNTGGDEDNLGTLESSGDICLFVSLDLLRTSMSVAPSFIKGAVCASASTYDRLGVNVRHIGGDTWRRALSAN